MEDSIVVNLVQMGAPKAMGWLMGWLHMQTCNLHPVTFFPADGQWCLLLLTGFDCCDSRRHVDAEPPGDQREIPLFRPFLWTGQCFPGVVALLLWGLAVAFFHVN